MRRLSDRWKDRLVAPQYFGAGRWRVCWTDIFMPEMRSISEALRSARPRESTTLVQGQLRAATAGPEAIGALLGNSGLLSSFSGGLAARPARYLGSEAFDRGTNDCHASTVVALARYAVFAGLISEGDVGFRAGRKYARADFI